MNWNDGSHEIDSLGPKTQISLFTNYLFFFSFFFGNRYSVLIFKNSISYFKNSYGRNFILKNDAEDFIVFEK